MSRIDDRFTPKVGPPKDRGKAKGPKLMARIVKRTTIPRIISGTKKNARPGARLGRGYVAAKLAGKNLTPKSRRVVVKSRIVKLKTGSKTSTIRHLRYIERDGVSADGQRGVLYSSGSDRVDAGEFEARGRGDRHQFRFIVAPEDATELNDLKTYTRDLMAQMERDLGTSLDWVAVDHWDTDNPHTHIVLRGKDSTGADLVIAGDYMAHGMRARAAELATEWLGQRTEREIAENLNRNVTQERWTELDRQWQARAHDGEVNLQAVPTGYEAKAERNRLIGRLQHLADMGLAEKRAAAVWRIDPDAETTLRAMGERGDVIRTMHRALRGEQREYAITDRRTTPIVGRIAGKGLADELHDRGYLVIDGVDGRAHYVRLGKSEDLADFPVGGIAEVRCNVARRADANIVEISRAGVYRVEDHRRAIESREANPDGYVAAHVRRLEALRRAGVVERVAEGVWAIPTDLVQQGRAYDAERYADQTVEVRSYIPLERQVRAQGATWLDRELLNPASQPAKLGFGSDVSQALHSRQAFLIEEGLARRQAQGVTFMQNLLAILTHRELNQVASAIATETGDIYREIRDGKPVSGIYRRSLMLASGRFALLEEAGGFALVPWRPVIEPRIGQSIAAVIEGNHVSWEFGRTRGISH